MPEKQQFCFKRQATSSGRRWFIMLWNLGEEQGHNTLVAVHTHAPLSEFTQTLDGGVDRLVIYSVFESETRYLASEQGPNRVANRNRKCTKNCTHDGDSKPSKDGTVSLLFSSVPQFKMVSMRSEKPICTPPRLSAISPALPLKRFQCSSD